MMSASGQTPEEILARAKSRIAEQRLLRESSNSLSGGVGGLPPRINTDFSRKSTTASISSELWTSKISLTGSVLQLPVLTPIRAMPQTALQSAAPLSQPRSAKTPPPASDDIEELLQQATNTLTDEFLALSLLTSCAPENRDPDYQNAEPTLYFSCTDPVPGHFESIEVMQRNLDMRRDEGYFVPDESSLELSNRLRMENRILKSCLESQISEWFGSDSRMITNGQEMLRNPMKPPYIQGSATSEEEECDDLSLIVHRPVRPEEESDEHYAMDETYQLVFGFHKLDLTEHPFMIEELRKAKELIEHVTDLNSRKAAKVTEYLEGKLLSLELQFAEFKTKYPSPEAYQQQRVSSSARRTSATDIVPRHRRKSATDPVTDQAHIEYLNELKSHLTQIQHVRDIFELEASNDRLTEWNIFKCWNTLKHVRKIQGFVSCSVRLVIQHDKSPKKGVFDLEEYYNATLANKKEMFDVEARIKELEPVTKKKVEATADPVEGVPETFASSEFDAEKVAKEIASNLESCFKKKDARDFILRVVFDEPITETIKCPMVEQLRRGNISSTEIFMKLHVNGKEIFKSQTAPLILKDFCVYFEETDATSVVVRTSEMPRDIEVELCEVNSFGKNSLGKCVFEVPDVAKQTRSVDVQRVSSKFEGSSFRITNAYDQYAKDARGIAEMKSQSGHIFLHRGELFAAIVWDVDEAGSPIFPKSRITSAFAKSQKAQTAEEKFDPNDPRLKIEELMKRLGKGADRTILGNELDFEDTYTTRKRLDILELRNDKKIFTKVPVSFLDDEIGPGTFEIQEEADLIEELDAKKLMPYAIQQAPVMQLSEFVKRIKAHDLYKLVPVHNLVKPSCYDDYVREEKLSDNKDSSFLGTLLRQRRPLKPERRSRLVKSSNTIPKDCKVVTQILSGINIPVRTADSGILEAKENGKKKEITNVRPYVEVQFQHKKERTGVLEGNHPQWNETIILPFTPPTENFKAENLHMISDNIYFNLFDEYFVDLIVDDRERGKKIHQRKERNWLGTLTIPFSTIYQHVTIDGKFHLRTPIVSLGYEKDDFDENILGVNTDETMLHLFVTLETPLPQPDSLRPKFESLEDDAVLNLVADWKHKIPTERYETPLVIDLTGKTLLCTRFIKSMQPPAGFDTVEKILRFVSMIPYFEDRNALSASLNLWSDSQQFIEIGAGDETEHAVLFCNYMLNLQKNAWVVIGRGIPEGRSSYVMVQEADAFSLPKTYYSWLFGAGNENKRLSLYNPLSGQKYTNKDAHCPLQEIRYVFNHENIWANIQDAVQPANMNFDFSVATEWMPLFAGPRVNALNTIQPASLTYPETDKVALKELERTIYQTLVMKMEKWRGRFVTKWNRAVARSFEAALPSLELLATGDRTVKREIILADIKKLQNTYRIRGFPINLPFTDIDAVVEAVYNTDIHTNQDTSIEFALAVYCHPFVKNVTSVWVYVASLKKTLR